MEWITLIFSLIEMCDKNKDKSDAQLANMIQNPGPFAKLRLARELALEDGTRLKRKNRGKYLRRVEQEAQALTTEEVQDIVENYRAG